MIINLAVFDEFIDIDLFKSTTRLEFEVVKQEPIFSSQIRLKKKKGKVFTFNTDRYYSNVTEFCYGFLFTVEISEENFEQLVFIMETRDYILDSIKITPIITDYQRFLKNKFKINGKSYLVLCFTTNTSEEYKSLFRNRHLTVNLHKSFLINILK